MNTLNEHPTPERLAAFGQGRLGPADEEAVADHVADCDACTEALRGVPDDALMGRLRAADTPPQDSRAPTAPPSSEVPAELRGHPRYRVLHCLGAGGMGVVFRAEHRLMERAVALKVIGREWTRNPQAVERFRQEVKAAARLDHPNIVRAFDAEQAGDVHFLVMEYVEGASLDRVVETEGPPPVADACRYALQAALGLQHAFEQGMVHRDVKPQNLMRTRQGQVKVLDFGLARLAARPARDGQALTAAGALLGTPDYIAPEQAEDPRAADVRSDVYGLGCTLYFLLTGRPPFPGGTPYRKVVAHFRETAPPPSAGRGDVPPGLDAVVARMMAKDPAARYATPAEAAAALAPFARTSARAARAPAGAPARAAATPTLAAPRRPAARAAPARKAAKAGAGRSRRLLAVGALAAFMALAAAGLLTLIAASNGWFPASPRGGPTGPAASRNPDVPSPAAPAGGPVRVLLVISDTDFWYPDYRGVRRVFDEAGASVKVASTAAGVARPSQDPSNDNPDPRPVTADLALADARAADYDAVVFLGGYRWKEFTEQGPAADAARRLIGDMLAADGKYVTALCTGTLVLADAGILKGKRATTHERVIYLLRPQGVTVINEPVVTEGRIITGRMPHDAEAFAQAVLRAAAKK